jgi:hypothetical protein
MRNGSSPRRERQTEHVKGYEDRSVSEEEGEGRPALTVNAEHGDTEKQP